MRDFAAWAERAGAAGCDRCLHALLEGRADYLTRPDPTLWRRSDVRVLLLDLAATRLTERCDLIAHAVPAVQVYLRFLDETDRMHPGSARFGALRRELEDAATAYPAAASDRSRFRLAKTFYTAMLADGVDLEDDDAVDRWMADFNRWPQSRRAALLTHLLPDQPELLAAAFIAREGLVAALAPGAAETDSSILLRPERRRPQTPVAFPPVQAPSPEEAIRAAKGSLLLDRVVTLARWAAPGRTATKAGLPVLRDLRELSASLGLHGAGTRPGFFDDAPLVRLLDWARDTEMIQLRRNGFVAGPRFAAWSDPAEPADDEVLSLWDDLFTLAEREDPLDGFDDDLRLVLDRFMPPNLLPTVMVMLYRAAGTDHPTIDARTLGGELFGHATAQLPVSVQERHLLHVTLSTALVLRLADLVDHGVLDLTGPDSTMTGAAPGKGPGAAPPAKESADAAVTLTPLGVWAMRETLLGEGAMAPAAT